MGRLVYSNLFNMGILEPIRKAFAEKGVDLAELEDIEDAALGNGGLGRLAACFLDSAVTKGVPLSGYGLRYRFGLFKQSFGKDGSRRVRRRLDPLRRSLELPPRQARRPGLLCRPDRHRRALRYAHHRLRATTISAPCACGQCEPQQELDFDAFNAQDYEKALLEKNKAEDITRVLYPNDSHQGG